MSFARCADAACGETAASRASSPAGRLLPSSKFIKIATRAGSANTLAISATGYLANIPSSYGYSAQARFTHR
jgi:hypothetical protein